MPAALMPSKMILLLSYETVIAAPACSGVDKYRAARRTCRAKAGRRAASAIEPVRHLHEEGVGRPEREQIAEISRRVSRPLGRQEPLAPLVPHQEERRAGLVLPAEHD